MRFVVLISITLLILVSCSERKPEYYPVGVWENTTHWDNNAITLTVRPDSVMLFKAEKSFCPGTKFFVAVGKWRIDKDSFLVMEQFKDGRRYELNELFPELVQTSKDSANVLTLDITARLIMRDSMIYDLTPDGKAFIEHAYRKTSDVTKPQ